VAVVAKPAQAAKTAKTALASCLVPQVNRSVTANAAISSPMRNIAALVEKSVQAEKAAKTAHARSIAPQANKSATANAAISNPMRNIVVDVDKPVLRARSAKTAHASCFAIAPLGWWIATASVEIPPAIRSLVAIAPHLVRQAKFARVELAR